MTIARPMYRSLVSYAVPISVLVLIGCGMLGEYSGFSQNKDLVASDRQKVKQDMKEAIKMVAAIANRNKPPKIVRRRSASPTAVPLFSKDHDWKEEERVQKALDRISSDKSTQLWEALVQKTNDRQYCITTYSWSSDDALIYSVGNMCRKLAYDRLCGVFERQLPSVPPAGCPIRLKSIQNDVLAWRKERKEKALYELQIEVCELAIRELRELDVDLLSDKEKDQARRKIEAEIMKIKNSRTPHIGRTGIPPAYPQRAAKRIREAFDSGSLEDVDFRLSK